MSLYRDEGVVLRTQKLGEADRIVTLLTREHGRVRAVAKGVRRTTSRFGARLEPFMHVDLQLATGRSLDVVTQAETIAPFGLAITGDYARYTVATVILETAERLAAEEREPALQHYLLLVGALRSIAEQAHEPGLVLDAYLLRGLAVAGFAPSFADCARCGVTGPHRFFSVPAGGMVCVGAGHRALLRRRRRRSLCSRPCSPATGRPRTPAVHRPAGRPAVSWPPSCSGTWSAGCGLCRWWSGCEQNLRPADAARGRRQTS